MTVIYCDEDGCDHNKKGKCTADNITVKEFKCQSETISSAW